MQQEIFSFKKTESLDWSHFIDGHENHDTLMHLTRWPRWDCNGMVIYGDQGVGKTHVSNLWAQTAGAIFVTEEQQFDPRTLFDSGCNFVIDSIDGFLKKKKYDWMFHFFNIAKEKNRYFLLLSRLHPSLWEIELDDLKSRLFTLPVTHMGNPEDELLLKIAKKLSKDLNINIPDEALEYILKIIDRRVNSVANVLDVLNRLSLQKQKKISLQFIKNHLKER